LGHHINFEFHFLYTFFRLFFSFLYIYIYREKVNQKYIYIFLINFLPGGKVFGQLYIWCSMVFDDPNLMNQKCFAFFIVFLLSRQCYVLCRCLPNILEFLYHQYLKPYHQVFRVILSFQYCFLFYRQILLKGYVLHSLVSYFFHPKCNKNSFIC
jgi:hypothetical protein